MAAHALQKLPTGDGVNNNELLVFGYACKLFRDDERAHLIENGHHLIPWMGDDSLKIDRYDGRGALNDLASHEPDPTKWDQLTFEELEIERMCDKERYRSLNSAVEEETLYQEEEMKRFYQQTSAYAQVGYVYEEKPPSSTEEEAQATEDTAPSEPFTLPPELSIPEDMCVPDTMKHNAIIERTAVFISQQGPQMEIIMKLKQHGNKQFDFLSHNDSLYPYYKHVLNCIKTGIYTPNTEAKTWIEEDPSDEADYDDYLHPSLVTKPLKRTPPGAPVEGPPPDPNSKQKNADSLDPKVPTDEVRQIIETMVRYVAKNGPAFEIVIGKRNDSRFSFLNEGHRFHSFYKERLQKAPKSEKWQPKKEEKEEPSKGAKEVSENEDDSNSSERSGKSLKRSKPTPVCFSIKKAKENEGLEVASALPVEDSSDEGEGEATGGGSGGSPGAAATADPTPAREASIESSDDNEPPLAPSQTDKKRKRTAGKRRNSAHHKEKDVHIQKERKMKVAQFLKGLKTTKH